MSSSEWHGQAKLVRGTVSAGRRLFVVKRKENQGGTDKPFLFVRGAQIPLAMQHGQAIRQRRIKACPWHLFCVVPFARGE
jgi:hypothetical protein